MRFLVLGSSGMAGHVISLFLHENGHSVTGFARTPLTFLKKAGLTVVCGDATEIDDLRNLVVNGEWDVVVNAIGVLNADADKDKATAVFINSFLPHALAKMTADLSTRIFHMSTDCVFAGNSGPYTEQSFPDGTTFYDRSKALGELFDHKNLTFRNSIVGPDPNQEGIGLLNWFMQQKGSIKGFSEAFWTGLTTVELAKAMEAAAVQGGSGLVNMVPADNISKYELLKLFNKYLRGGQAVIDKDETFHLDKTLIRTNFKHSFVPLSYESQIEELGIWIREHKDLYPHYAL